MSAHRRLLAEHLDFPAPAPAPAGPGADAWDDHPAGAVPAAGAEPEVDLARRIAPDLLLPDEESAAVRERSLQLNSSLKPWDTFEMWLTERVALQEIRLVRCRAQELLLRDRLARRAILCWDEDRRAVVASLGGKLGRRPDEVAAELGRTRHGCEWLLARWDALDAALDAGGGWDDARRGRALDLLGIPPEDRAGRTPLDPPEGVDVARHLRAVVAGAAGRLRSRKASALDDLDARERDAAALGVGLEGDPELARLRRAERSHERSLQWYLSRFKKTRPGSYHPPDPIRRPEPAAMPRFAAPPPALPEQPAAGEMAAAMRSLNSSPVPETTSPEGKIMPPPIRVPLAACLPVLTGTDTGGQAAGGTPRGESPGTGSRADLGTDPRRPVPREVPPPDHPVAFHPGEFPGNRRRRRAAASRARQSA